MRMEYQTIIDTIRAGAEDDNPALVFEAAKRLINEEVPQAVIDELAEIAFTPENNLWSRVAAIYTLGWVDAEAVTEARIREISCDASNHSELRDHADEALYYFASRRHILQHERDHPDADHYEGLKYREWRDQQSDLAPEDSTSFAKLCEVKYGPDAS